MATLLEKAAKGKRSALKTLYKENRQQVYFLSHAMLRDQNEAAEVSMTAFREVWPSVLAGNVKDEEMFRTLLIQKTAEGCRKKLVRKNPKMFKVFGNQNFILTSVDTENMDKAAGKLDTLLELLPDFQRFMLVLRIGAEYEPEEIAKISGISKNILRNVQEAEQYNLARICETVQKAGGNALLPTKEIIRMEFDEAIFVQEVPSDVDELVSQYIDIMVKPAEKRNQKRTAAMGLAAVIMLVIIIVVLIPKEGRDSSDTQGTYYADIAIENYGTVTVELDSDAAPITVNNFVELAQSGFYDGLTFHRIIEGFMMQGGDPDADGTGGSGETIVGEFSDNGYENALSHTRGAVSMARSGDSYDSASSQFFIVQEDSTDLDGQYAVFGYVTEGLDIVDAVCEAAEPTDDNGTISLKEQPVITSITIRNINQENDQEE